MLANFAVLYILLGKLDILFTVSSIILIVSALVLLAVTIYNSIESKNACYGDTTNGINKRYFEMLIKPTKIVCVLALVSFLILVFIPSKTDAVLYASMKTVDEYSIEHPESMLNADSILGVVDKTFKKLDDLVK